jgi:hypothetical protein
MDAVVAAASSASAAPAGVGAIDAAVAGWPAASRTEALLLAKKYGAPKETEAGRIAWVDASPWKTTVVLEDGPTVEQTLAHRFAPEEAERLASFEHVKVDAEAGTVVVRHASEARNFAAVNLAHEVATGRRTLPQAEARWAAIEKDLANGKTPPEAQRLAFAPKPAAADPGAKDAPAPAPADDLGR